jgi:hypothetical protein
MRKLCIAVALGLAAMAADAATTGNSVRPLGTPSSTSAISMAPSNTAPVGTTSTSTGGTTTGGSTGSTTTTTATTTTATGATANTALSGTLTNGASLGAVTGSTANALGSTLANGSTLSSGGNAAAAAATGTGTNTTTTNGGVAGIVTVDNGLGVLANGVNANGEVIGSTLQQPATSLPQQQVFVQQQSALAPEFTALERRELRKRNNVPKNAQLLNSVAPRTNVDRTWQMPDDPPSPALSISPLR